MEALNDAILQAAASPWVLVVMFAVAVIDAVFPPVPSETVLVAGAAASAAAGDPTTVLLLCAVAAAGAVIGDNLAYALGRRAGTTRFAWMRRPRIAAAFARAEHALAHRGAPLILGARYIPVGRVAVNLSAGALRYPWRRFLPLSALAATSWAAFSAGIGVLAGHWFADRPAVSALIGIVLALAVGLVVDRVAAARRRRPVGPGRVDAPGRATVDSASAALNGGLHRCTAHDVERPSSSGPPSSARSGSPVRAPRPSPTTR